MAPLNEFLLKAMIPIGKKPLIEHIVEYLNKCKSITEIIVVIDDSSLGDQIENFFDGKDAKYGTPLRFRRDRQEGTAGALLRCKEDLKNEKDFLVWFSDNLSNLDLDEMIEKFHYSQKIGCIATSKTRKEEHGFVAVDEYNLIVNFLEKPTLRLTYPISLGVYVFSTDIIGLIGDRAKDKGGTTSLTFDVFENLPSGALYNYDIGEKLWIDIEGPNKIKRNADIIEKILENS